LGWSKPVIYLAAGLLTSGNKDIVVKIMFVSALENQITLSMKFFRHSSVVCRFSSRHIGKTSKDIFLKFYSIFYAKHI